MRPAPEAKSLARTLHVVLDATPDAVRDGLVQMMARQPLATLSEEERGAAELVLAEVLNNVAEHAYADTAGTVAVTLVPARGGIDCLVIDQGVALPNRQMPAGKLIAGPETPVEDLPEGGFGWHLIRSLTRDLTYARDGGCNRLSFTLPNGA